jgi:hypothetical protein
MHYYFNASEVAALIGKHKYKSADDALLLFLHKNCWDLPPHVQTALKNETIQLRIANLQKSTLAETVPEIQQAVQIAAAARTDVDDETVAQIASSMATRTNVPEVVSTMTRAELVHVLKECVHKKRGRDEESEVLDQVARKHKTIISEQNTEFKKFYGPSYCIGGRRDGFMDTFNRVVEVKTRRNWFTTCPEYDLIQLRVYMKLWNCDTGMLVEKHQQSDKYRETVISDDQWDTIDSALQAVVKRIEKADEFLQAVTHT